MTTTIKSLIHQEALERYQPMPHESKTGMGAQRLGRRRKDWCDGAEWAVEHMEGLLEWLDTSGYWFEQEDTMCKRGWHNNAQNNPITSGQLIEKYFESLK